MRPMAGLCDHCPVWLRVVDGEDLSGFDWTGAGLTLPSMGVTVFGPRKSKVFTPVPKRTSGRSGNGMYRPVAVNCPRFKKRRILHCPRAQVKSLLSVFRYVRRAQSASDFGARAGISSASTIRFASASAVSIAPPRERKLPSEDPVWNLQQVE
jgi:hypothetical protein